jgi:hypothetical protein
MVLYNPAAPGSCGPLASSNGTTGSLLKYSISGSFHSRTPAVESGSVFLKQDPQVMWIHIPVREHQAGGK